LVAVRQHIFATNAFELCRYIVEEEGDNLVEKIPRKACRIRKKLRNFRSIRRIGQENKKILPSSVNH